MHILQMHSDDDDPSGGKLEYDGVADEVVKIISKLLGEPGYPISGGYILEQALALCWFSNLWQLLSLELNPAFALKWTELTNIPQGRSLRSKTEGIYSVAKHKILRSMLYRGSEVMREVAWVIFDEIYYMRDKERGVVWEETIILLPHAIRYFAEWICKSHGQPCHVVYTEFRPTPLQHELGEDSADSKSGRANKGKSNEGGNRKQSSDISRLVQMIMQKNCNPVIVFSFSRRECERNTLEMVKFKFSSVEEEDLTANIFNSAIDNLSVEDRQLPQTTDFFSLLKRGIGIHHSSLLPILKEVFEILFQEGLIKVLFAMETFSIGLNMPAKTVVFTGMTKWDGKERRSLSSGEYIQMSGRAGRRGLDERRIVIMMCDEKIEPVTAKAMITGQADRLDSAFRVGYNMVSNLMKVESISREYLLQRSFFQFQNSAKIPGLEEELRKEVEAMAKMPIPDKDLISRYYEYQSQLDQMNRSIPVPDELPPHEQYTVDVLLKCAAGQKGIVLIVPILLSAIEGICSLRIFLPKDLAQGQQRETVWKSVLETRRWFPDDVPLLDPLRDMGIKDEKFAILVKRYENGYDHRRSRIQASQNALQLDELKSQKRVLRRLGFTTSAEIVDVKRCIACELSSGDELLLTELIFNGVFNTLSLEQYAALLSCFVFDEESNKVRAELAAPLCVMQEIARRMAKVSKESKLPIGEEGYVAPFKVELMDAVMQWCRGVSFQDIKKLTADIFEGSIIRVFRRLGELLRQMASAAKVIGNAELQGKFQMSLEILERPSLVIFCICRRIVVLGRDFCHQLALKMAASRYGKRLHKASFDFWLGKGHCCGSLMAHGIGDSSL
ncbi:DSHCT-domain-containing protein [Armillaria solidipes]|uniref:DSHCT-domain-containing protein n=1 Tax=Armillaria solidipes TaxID=1076256 RepID=A0A2H3AV69_9AGAR|nr:DSHCT-domain-containing protein [Armillaria solidipes]